MDFGTVRNILGRIGSGARLVGDIQQNAQNPGTVSGDQIRTDWDYMTRRRITPNRNAVPMSRGYQDPNKTMQPPTGFGLIGTGQ